MESRNKAADADRDTELNGCEADGEAGSDCSVDSDHNGNVRSSNTPLACFAALGDTPDLSQAAICKRWMALIRSFMMQKNAPRAMKRPRGLFPIWV